jgi:hypothetical protein
LSKIDRHSKEMEGPIDTPMIKKERKMLPFYHMTVVQ